MNDELCDSTIRTRRWSARQSGVTRPLVSPLLRWLYILRHNRPSIQPLFLGRFWAVFGPI